MIWYSSITTSPLEKVVKAAEGPAVTIIAVAVLQDPWYAQDAARNYAVTFTGQGRRLI